jgi:hypothetical protein
MAEFCKANSNLRVLQSVNGEVIRPSGLDNLHDGANSVRNGGQIALLGSPSRQLEKCWHTHITHGLQLKGYASRQLTFLFLILLLFSFLLSFTGY